MPDNTQIKALLARLKHVPCTHGGDLIESLTVEADAAGIPKLIRGFVLEPGTGPDGFRRSPCTWLPNGRHRLYPKLNLCLPQS